MYAPCLELNFLICVGCSSSYKLNHWFFLYVAVVSAGEVNASVELEKRQRALSPLHAGRALVPAVQRPSQAESEML